MKITIAGAGHVGLANAVLLAQHNDVALVDIDAKRVQMLNRGESPLPDKELRERLAGCRLSLFATTDASAYKNADIIVIATPTDYDSEKGSFDTSSVESVIGHAAAVNPDAVIVIKSTVPVGFTRAAQQKYKSGIIFSPEFLREGRALYDNLHPSRIIVGAPLDNDRLCRAARDFAALLAQGAEEKDIPVMLTQPEEAEAVKLFANTYLALRVAFFNELDTYAEVKGLNSRRIIEGVCHDPRIGDFYNNPSFGYGGYCLPKDTRQLLANFDSVPNNIIGAVVEANRTRKSFIAERVLQMAKQRGGSGCLIGVYGLAAKSGADNFRQSSIIDIIKQLKGEGASIAIYEPALAGESFLGCRVIRDFEEFKKLSTVIIANRYDRKLASVIEKVYTRDIYLRD